MNLYRFIAFGAKRATWQMNRYVWERNAIDTYIKKTTDYQTEKENKDPHIFYRLSVFGSGSSVKKWAVKPGPSLTENRQLTTDN